MPKRFFRSASILMFAVLVAVPIAAFAQEWSVDDDDDWCDDGDWGRGRDRTLCEVRVITLPADREVIEVSGGRNGGVSVRSWDRNEIEVRAKISVKARDREDAEELFEAVELEVDDIIRARAPRTRDDDENVSVSWRIMVPRRSNLELSAYNGGISVEGVTGDIEFETHNGGVSLADVGGDVRGETRNGGLKVELTGDRWDGEGLDVRTRNGGIKMEIPRGYSADLEVGTKNGGIDMDVPMMVQGRLNNRVRGEIGDGGPPVRVVTVNGGVKIDSY